MKREYDVMTVPNNPGVIDQKLEELADLDWELCAAFPVDSTFEKVRMILVRNCPEKEKDHEHEE